MGWEFEIVDYYLQSICASYVRFPFSWALVVFLYYPYFISVGLVAVSLYKNEKYLQLVSAVLLMDWLLNRILVWAVIGFRETFYTTERSLTSCGETDYGFIPSFAAEQSAVFASMISGLFSHWPKQNTSSVVQPVMMSLSMSIPNFIRMFLGVNTPLQIVYGACVGFLEGSLWLWVIYFYIVPLFPLTDNYRLLRTTLALEDNMCHATEKMNNRVIF